MQYKKLKKILGLMFAVVIVFLSSNNVFAITLSPVRLELSGNPGDIVSSKITVTNEADANGTFYSSFANFEAQGESGSPTFVEPKEGLGTWITTDSSVTLDSNSTSEIQFSIKIPENAEPGGYFAAIFWSTTPPSDQGGVVTVGAKTGVLVLLSVNGDIKEGGAILNYGTKDDQKFYTALPVSFTYRFQNTGNDRVKPNGTIAMRNFIGIKVASVPANKVEGNVLPKSIRKFESAWQKGAQADSADVTASRNFFDNVSYQWRNFALGYFTAHLNLEYGTDKQTTHAKTGFWVFPWQLLIVIIILAIIAWIIIKTIIKRYNHWIIMQAQVNIEHELGIDENSKVAPKRRVTRS